MVSALAAKAEETSFMDSEYFEPAMACAIAGGVGYYTAPQGKELPTSIIGCAVGGLIVNTVSNYFKDKHTKNKDKEVDKYKKAVDAFQAAQAQKAARGEKDIFSIRIQEVVPGQKLPNGEIVAPTVKEKLVLPGSDLLVGE